MNTNNFLNPQNFKFLLKRAPNLEFFVQGISLPGLHLPSIDISNQFVPIKGSNTHMSYDPLMVKFKIDENMRNYDEIYDWICKRGFPSTYDQYRSINQEKPTSGKWIYSDISIIIENSNHQGIAEYQIIDAFPTSLSSIELNTTDNNVQFISATATFEFTRMLFDLL